MVQQDGSLTLTLCLSLGLVAGGGHTPGHTPTFRLVAAPPPPRPADCSSSSAACRQCPDIRYHQCSVFTVNSSSILSEDIFLGLLVFLSLTAWSQTCTQCLTLLETGR